MGKHVKTAPRAKGRRRTILVAAALASAGFIGGTVSAFTDTATSDISVTAGTINLMVNDGGTDAKSITLPPLGNFGPGMSANRTITLKNTGTLPMVVDLHVTTTGSADFAAYLTGTVNVNSSDLYEGPLNVATFDDVAVPAGGSVPLVLTIEWVSGPDDNTYAGQSVVTELHFTAESAT